VTAASLIADFAETSDDVRPTRRMAALVGVAPFRRRQRRFIAVVAIRGGRFGAALDGVTWPPAAARSNPDMKRVYRATEGRREGVRKSL